MRERPILFSGPMVRALLSGRKTQTRRLLNPQPAPNAPNDGGTTWMFGPRDGRHVPCGTVGHMGVAEKMGLRCPYGVPGDRLWGRETWAPHADEEETFRNYHAAWSGRGGIAEPGAIRPEVFYRADDGDPFINKWRPSIFMPRWASRLLLDVVKVRVERLQDISEEDARAEGALAERERMEEAGVTLTDECPSARRAFRRVWEGIHGPGSWDANPWVWVVSFTRAA